MSYKPEGYPSVSPYLVVKHAAPLISFLEEVFGAEVTRRFPRPDGTLAHAEVKIDDSIIMLGEAPAGWEPTPGMVHVYVPDVHQVWERALKAGALPEQEPADKGDGDVRGGFRGPCGNSWWIGTQKEP